MTGTNIDAIPDECQRVYQSLHDRYIHQESLSIVMSHYGTFSQDLVNSLSEGAEEILISANEKKPLIKRIFSILIEGLQNIRLHGESDLDGIRKGILFVARGDGFYKIAFGNLILNSNRERMESRLSELNSLSEENLKIRYMEVLSNSILSNRGGAGLGFITMSMKSRSKLDFHFHVISERFSMFTVELKIEKEKQ